MIYLMGPGDRQSFEVAASRLTLGVKSPKTARRSYLYQSRTINFFNIESSEQIGEPA